MVLKFILLTNVVFSPVFTTFVIELINRIVYDEIKNHSGFVMYLALLEFNLRENVVMVFKLNMTV